MSKPEQQKQPQVVPGEGNRLQRYTFVSVLIHSLVFVSLAFTFSKTQKPTFAEPLYQVAFLEAEVPNYEPPKPTRTEIPEKKPEVKPPPKVEEVQPPEPEAVPVETKPKPKPKPIEKKPEPEVVKKAEKKPDPVPLKPAKAREEKSETVEPEVEPEVEEIKAPKEVPVEPVSVGSVDQKDFKHNYYLQVVRARLAREWDRPGTGAGLLQSTVHFIIKRDGTVLSPEVTEPSGNTIYDRAALSAVFSVKQLPPLPDTYSGDQIGISVVFQTKFE